MRLSDTIMRASDEATANRIDIALALAAAGRFGLIPSVRQFEHSLKFNGESVEVQSLDCVAVTRGGFLIDLQFDTRYTKHLETLVDLPDKNRANDLFLIISVDPKQWTETIDEFEEPAYTFDLISTNSPVSDNALPIAHIYYSNEDRGWQVDKEDFVPPCLFVSSHMQYVELLNQFIQKVAEVEAKIFRTLPEKTSDDMPMSEVHEALRIFWPAVQQILIDTDKNRDLMTPLSLLGNVQKYIAIFTSACRLDPYLKLSDAERFRNYALAPYDYMNAYAMIKEGLSYCFLIAEKVEAITSEKKTTERPERPERPKPKAGGQLAAPSIADELLYVNCRNSSEIIPIINNAPGSAMYFSADGSMPSKPVANGKITIQNTFNHKKVPENDQELVVKLKAVLNGAESNVSNFTVILHKDYGNWKSVPKV